MPAQYVIDVDRRTVYTVFSGVLTFDEVVAQFGQLRSDPNFKPAFSELVDLSQAQDLRLGYADFQQLARVDPFSEEAKRAFLVPTNGAVMGVTRMFQIIRDNPKIQIFRTREEALDFLQNPD